MTRKHHNASKKRAQIRLTENVQNSFIPKIMYREIRQL